MMVFSKSPAPRSRPETPREDVARRIFAEFFGNSPFSENLLQNKKVISALQSYNDVNDGSRVISEETVRIALFKAVVEELADEDIKASPVTDSCENYPVRLNAVYQRFLQKLAASKNPINTELVYAMVSTIFERKFLAAQVAYEGLQEAIRERSGSQKWRYGEAQNVDLVAQPIARTRRRAMNTVMPLSVVSLCVLAGTFTAQNLFCGKAVSEGTVMSGRLGDDGSTVSGPAPRTSLPATRVTPITAPPTPISDLPPENREYIITYEEAPGHFEVRLIKDAANQTLVDEIHWVGSGTPSVDLKKCEAVNAVAIDSEVVGFECPLQDIEVAKRSGVDVPLGHTVTLAVEKRDVDEKSRAWQAIPTRIKPERKKGGKVKGP